MPTQVQSRPLPLESRVTDVSCGDLHSVSPCVQWERRLLDSGSCRSTVGQEGAAPDLGAGFIVA